MMKKSKTLALSAAFAASAIFSSTSSAFFVDFTDATKWGQPANSTADYFVGAADYIYPGPFQVRVTSESVPASSTKVAWEQNDGFGVKGPGDNAIWDDDIENFNGTPVTEILRVAFSIDTLVSRIRISDFVGQGEYNTGSGWMAFGPGAGTNGPGDWFSITSLSSGGIAFRALDGQSSFQVSGLDVDLAPVPLPPAVWLLGSAMVFLFRKRQVS